MHPLRKLREAGITDPEQFAAILAPNVVMHSPVLIKAIQGRDVVAHTLSLSTKSRDNPGKYLFEGKFDERTTLLHWEGTVEGHTIQSLEMLTDDENGLLVDRTVAYRPYPAVRLFRKRLYEGNQGRIPDEFWEFPDAKGAVKIEL
jgi:hypothetical protein